MTDTQDGMMYAPKAAKPEPVVGGGDFKFAAAYFDHGHLNGQINGLAEAGGELAMRDFPTSRWRQRLRKSSRATFRWLLPLRFRASAAPSAAR